MGWTQPTVLLIQFSKYDFEEICLVECLGRPVVKNYHITVFGGLSENNSHKLIGCVTIKRCGHVEARISLL